MIDGELKFDHNKQDELGWKLFTLRLADIIATMTAKLATLAAMLWAFQTFIQHTLKH